MKKFGLLIATLLVTFSTFAHTEKSPLRRGDKNIVAVLEKADKNDWKAYTHAAQLAINWNADLALAKEWLDHSMSVEVNATNLEVLGDYYLRSGEKSKAVDTYLKAIETGVATLDAESLAILQHKVMVNAK